MINAEVLHGVLHILDRGIDGVDGDYIDGIIGSLVLLSGNPSAALIDSEVDGEACARIQMADDKVGVQDFESWEDFADVTGCELFLTWHSDGCFLKLGLFNCLLEIDFFEVKDDVGHIFLDTGDSVKLVAHAVDADRRYSEAFERGEEDTTKGVTYGDTITRLQWLKLKFTEVVIGFQH